MKKINYTAWLTPYDPQIYTTIKLDITTSKKVFGTKSN